MKPREGQSSLTVKFLAEVFRCTPTNIGCHLAAIQYSWALSLSQTTVSLNQFSVSGRRAETAVPVFSDVFSSLGICPAAEGQQIMGHVSEGGTHAQPASQFEVLGYSTVNSADKLCSQLQGKN